MTYRPRAHCIRCGLSRQAVGHLSRLGNCLACGIAAEAANMTQLRAQAGPYYERWRTAMIDAVAGLPGGVAIPDRLPDESEQEARPLAVAARTGG